MADHMTAEQLRAELGAAAEQWKREAADAERSNDADVWMLCLRAAGQLAEVSARLSGMAAVPTWQPIETAPKDRRIELWIPGSSSLNPGKPTHGEWESQRLHARPRPFWRYDLLYRESDMRERQPTHWREPSASPEPPHV